jgi:hypothetical protein
VGVIKHKDIFSAKYITAVITDSNDRGYFVPIKKTIDDFFITMLNGNYYAFTLEGARIITYRELAIRSVKFVQYDTSHFRSLQKYYKELELMLKKNMLPKMNRVQLACIRLIGRKERYQENGKEITRLRYEVIKSRNEIKEKHEKNPSASFTPFEIKELLDDLAENEKDYPDEVENIKNYLKSLDIDTLVTPVGRLADNLQDDLITTKASFLGELVPRLQRVDYEHKVITNKPVTGRIPYLKLGLIAAMILGVVAFIAVGIDEGWFDMFVNMMPSAENFGGAFTPPAQKAVQDVCSDAYLQSNYTPQELKAAVDRGDIDYDKCLSDDMKKMVDTVELPKVEPKQ